MQSRLPPELERYTLSPPWQQEQQDEARRRKAIQELQRRAARA
ncbi:hypothetical protein [Sphingomonas parva]|nr:hypothetical protein [Sphingomonas parva]